jgi:hypothetical protein
MCFFMLPPPILQLVLFYHSKPKPQPPRDGFRSSVQAFFGGSGGSRDVGEPRRQQPARDDATLLLAVSYSNPVSR